MPATIRPLEETLSQPVPRRAMKPVAARWRDGGDHSGVAYPETETMKAAVVAPLDGNLLSLLAHEANHVYIRNGLGRPGTSFINEGLASALVSERLGAFGPSVYHQWVRARLNQIPSIADLADDDRWGQHPSSTAYTVSASFLAYLSGTFGPAPLRQIYEGRPALLWGVVNLLAQRLRNTDSALADSVFLDVTGRTAKRLLELAGDADEFALPITQEELAGMVGASRERVNKAIASFVRLRWIEQQDRRYRITNREELERRAR